MLGEVEFVLFVVETVEIDVLFERLVQFQFVQNVLSPIDFVVDLLNLFVQLFGLFGQFPADDQRLVDIGEKMEKVFRGKRRGVFLLNVVDQRRNGFFFCFDLFLQMKNRPIEMNVAVDRLLVFVFQGVIPMRIFLEVRIRFLHLFFQFFQFFLLLKEQKGRLIRLRLVVAQRQRDVGRLARPRMPQFQQSTTKFQRPFDAPPTFEEKRIFRRRNAVGG